MRRARLFSLLISALAARPTASQVQLSADVGASRLQRPDVPQSGALTLGLTVAGASDYGWLRSSVLAVGANSQQSTFQGIVAGSFTGASTRWIRGELAGFVSGFTESGYSPTLSGEIMPRVQVGNPLRGGALGVGIGGMQHEMVTASVKHAEADAWLGFANEQFASSLSFVKTTGTFVGDEAPNAAPSYYDLTGAWRHDRSGIVLGVSGGYRYGTRSTNAGSWGSVDAALWLLPQTALVLSVGRSLDDPVRGVPRTTFASVGFRVTGAAHEAIGRRRTVKGATISVQRIDASNRRFEIRGVKASRVEVMGDFTDWSPLSLEMVGDVWRCDRAVTPGLHRIAIRIDGGEWIAPANIPSTADDLGGVVGLITVP